MVVKHNATIATNNANAFKLQFTYCNMKLLFSLILYIVVGSPYFHLVPLD